MHFLPKKHCFYPKRHFLCPKISKKSAYIATNLNLRQKSVCSGLKFLSESKLFGGYHPCSRATSATLSETRGEMPPSLCQPLTLSLLILVTLVGKLQNCSCTALEVTNVVENSATPAFRIFLAKNIQRQEKHSIGPGNGTE